MTELKPALLDSYLDSLQCLAVLEHLAKDSAKESVEIAKERVELNGVSEQIQQDIVAATTKNLERIQQDIVAIKTNIRELLLKKGNNK